MPNAVSSRITPTRTAKSEACEARSLSTCTTRQIPPLLGASKAQLTEWMQSQGQPAYRGQQLHQWLYQKGIRSLAEVTVFPQKWRDTVADVPVGRSRVHSRVLAQDGTVKYLLELADGQIIETVGIPTAQRLTVCVSSQVGCAMACDFCATGKG
ncbi:MAG TPA: hypothetical protein V6D19_22695, partial [Stenomitos sp.]